MKILLSIFSIFIGYTSTSFAETKFSLEGSLQQDQKNVSGNSTIQQSAYDGRLSFSLYSESYIYVALGALYAAAQEPIDTTKSANLTTLNPYGGIEYRGKSSLGFGAYYSPSTNSTYQQTGSVTEKWAGNAYWVKIGASPMIDKTWGFAFNLNYYSGNFTSKSTTASFTTVSSFTRSYFFPSLGVNIHW